VKKRTGAAEPASWRAYFASMGALALANLVLVWALPVLPGQDLPQHLAYARIFSDYLNPDLPFREFYELPARFAPYHSIYLLLGAMGRWISVLAAVRVLYSLYVLLTFLGVHLLVECSHRGEEPQSPPWTALGACAIVWGPTVIMGFLPFIVCIPLFILACAFLLRWTAPQAGRFDGAAALVCCVLMASIHVVAAGALALYAILLLLANWSHRDNRLAWKVAGACMAVFFTLLI
jgi:hypothetical protein